MNAKYPKNGNHKSWMHRSGVLFGCFGRKVDGPGLPGGLIIYQGHLLPLKGHLWLDGEVGKFAMNPTKYPKN